MRKRRRWSSNPRQRRVRRGRARPRRGASRSGSQAAEVRRGDAALAVHERGVAGRGPRSPSVGPWRRHTRGERGERTGEPWRGGDAEREWPSGLLQAQLLGVERPETLATPGVQVEVLRNLGSTSGEAEGGHPARPTVDGNAPPGPRPESPREPGGPVPVGAGLRGTGASRGLALEPTLAADPPIRPEHPATLGTLLRSARPPISATRRRPRRYWRGRSRSKGTVRPGAPRNAGGSHGPGARGARPARLEAVTLLRQVDTRTHAFYGPPCFNGARAMCGSTTRPYAGRRDLGGGGGDPGPVRGWFPELLECAPSRERGGGGEGAEGGGTERRRAYSTLSGPAELPGVLVGQGARGRPVRRRDGRASGGAAAERGDDARDGNWTGRVRGGAPAARRHPGAEGPCGGDPAHGGGGATGSTDWPWR